MGSLWQDRAARPLFSGNVCTSGDCRRHADAFEQAQDREARRTNFRRIRKLTQENTEFMITPFELQTCRTTNLQGHSLSLIYLGRIINVWQVRRIPIVTCTRQIGHRYFLTWDELGAFFDADAILNCKPAPLQTSLFTADQTDDWGDSRDMRSASGFQRRLL